MPFIRSFLGAAMLGLIPLAALAEDRPVKFFDFTCKGLERHKGWMVRTVETAQGDVMREFQCVDRSCFHWSVQNAGTADETHLIEHVYIREADHAYVLSWMVKRQDAEQPVFRYSRVKQLLDCTSPSH